jgi:hypothetical protein
MKNYILTYTLYDKNNKIIISGKMRAKRKLSEFDAKCGLEKHLKGKYPSMCGLVVHSCCEDYVIFEMFKDIFK